MAQTKLRSLLLLLSVFSGAQLEAVPYQLAHTFRDPEPAADDYFGTAIAIEDGVVAIKSRSGYADGDNLSRTHVFEANGIGGWTPMAEFDFEFEFDPDEPLRGSYFIGEELAIGGGTIAVGFGGNPYKRPSGRPLQVLSRNATGDWSEQFASLDFRSPGLGNQSGFHASARSVGASADSFIAVGSASASSTFAMVFERTDNGSWLETANLVFDQSVTSYFPYSTDIEGNTAALVSATGPGRGVTFFERQPSGNWIQTQSFLVEGTNERFYGLLDLERDSAVIRDLGSGALATYKRIDGVWRETLAPLAPPAAPNQAHSFDTGGFALEGDLLARTVGGVLEDESAFVEVFQRTAAGNWDLLTTIENPLPDAGLEFGVKLALDGGRLLIGARSTLADPTTPGAAFLFVPVPEPSTVVLVVAALSVLVSRRH